MPPWQRFALWIAANCQLLPLSAQTLAAQDAATLLEAKAAADTSQCNSTYVDGWQHDYIDWREYCGSSGCGPCPLDSWTEETELCGLGHDDWLRGWLGVRCDALGGRVVQVALGNNGVGGELLPFFGRLGALLSLNLGSNQELRGSVADLAGASELRYVNLEDCPLITVDIGALTALLHLGGEFTSPYTGGVLTGSLRLRGSGVHGSAAALRAMPGLGAGWGSYVGDFTPCSAFGGEQASLENDYTWGTGSPGCGAAGLAPVAVSHLWLLTDCTLRDQTDRGLLAGCCGRRGDRRVRLLPKQPGRARGRHGALRNQLCRHMVRLRHSVRQQLDRDRRPKRQGSALPGVFLLAGRRGVPAHVLLHRGQLHRGVRCF